LELSLAQLAELVGGSLDGPADRVVSGINGIQEAGPDELTFLANPKYAPALAGCRAGVVLVRPDQDIPPGLAAIRVDDPYLAFAKILTVATKKPHAPLGVHPRAEVAPSAQLGVDVTIHALAYVGENARIGDRSVIHPGVYVGEGARVGDDTVIHPNVTIGHGCLVGNRCIIHSGTVIGADGYGFVPTADGHFKIPQIGVVQIDDDVEIGAGNTIDRAALGRTWIQRGVKTDNMVHVAHNCVIGENTLLVAQVGVSGSTKVGKNVIMGGQTGVAGHLTIGDDVKIAAKSGVHGDLEPGEIVAGIPAIPHRMWLRNVAAGRRLADLFDRVKKLEKRLNALQAKDGVGS